MANVWFADTYVDGVPPDKQDIRDNTRDYVALSCTIAELRALTTLNQRYATVDGVLFAYDSTDTLTADDGVEVIVSASNQRYKRCKNSLIVGGTGVGSSLKLRSTSGVGTSDAIIFQLGNNGAIEAGRFVNSSGVGRLGLGTTAPNCRFAANDNAVDLPAPLAGTVAQFGGADGVNARVGIHSFGTVSPCLDFVHARGTAALPTETQLDDLMARISGRGRAATQYSASQIASIEFRAAENFTDTAQGTYIRFNTTPTGGASFAEAARITAAKAFVCAGAITAAGLIGAGVASPSGAWIHVAAGTTSVAMRRAASGVVLTTPVSGSEEFDGTCFYSTVASGRGVSPSMQFRQATADFAGSNVNTAQAVFDTPNTFNLQASTTYEFEAKYYITRAAGTTSHTTAVLFGGTVTVTSITYIAEASTATGNALAAASFIRGTSLGAVVVTAASTSSTENLCIHLRGTIRTNAAGTLIPQFQYSAAPGGAPTILSDSYFRLIPLGASTAASVGNLS